MGRYVLYGGTAVTGGRFGTALVVIEGERIREVVFEDEASYADVMGRALSGKGEYEGFGRICVSGKYVLAGGIDAHTHFREPGLVWKADMETESGASVAGGVTSFIDMPNTKPATVSAGALTEKLGLAEGRCHANYGFHIGADNTNSGEVRETLRDMGKRVGGVKVFMGSSTGGMLVDSGDALEDFFSIKGKTVLVHCEDEGLIREGLEKARQKWGEEIPFWAHPQIRSRRACILSSLKALETAMRLGTKLHLCHISTKEEAEMVRAAKLNNPQITAETSVNYLHFCDEDYARLGSRVKCNPAIKTADDRQALRDALACGVIDCLASDHAPHLAEEKRGKYGEVPSGIPSIQFTLPLLLSIAEETGMPLTRAAEVFSEKPAEIFKVRDRGFLKAGYYADIVVFDPSGEHEVTDGEVLSKCGWTPFAGETLKGKVERVFVNGEEALGTDGLHRDRKYGKELFFD
ncbi:MAG: amidohydrolase family protein [Candidatus Cryptobacteroides sp.]